MTKIPISTVAYCLALVVIFVDTMGIVFSIPILVPYGNKLGADTQTIAAGGSIRFACGVISVVWMSVSADKRGIRLTVFASMIGSGVSYFLQGIALYAGRVPTWFVGRAIAGLFGGTAPVMNTYITKISKTNGRADDDLVKKRLTILTVANQGVQILLNPLAGLLALISLNAPYFFSLGAAFVAFAVMQTLFKNPEEVDQLEAATGKRRRTKPKKEKQKSQEAHSTDSVIENMVEKKENPVADPVVWLIFWANFFMFLTVMGYIILLPLLLEQDKYDLQGDDDDETKENVASMMGLLMIPNGLASLTMSTLFYVPLSDLLGEFVLVGISGVGGSVTVACFGFLPEEVFHLLILQGCMGIVLGLIIPAVSPILARYSSYAYKKKMAQAQGFPMLGMMISSMFAQLTFATIEQEASMEAGWYFGAACVGLVTFFVEIALLRMWFVMPTKKLEDQSEDSDIDKFIRQMVKELRKTLLDQSDQLWNSVVQDVVRDKVAHVVPEFDWDQNDQGYDYLMEMQLLLQGSKDGLEKFHKQFPHVAANRNVVFPDVAANQKNINACVSV